jgi:outer membrane receptor protein involved in Fe transport
MVENCETAAVTGAARLLQGEISMLSRIALALVASASMLPMAAQAQETNSAGNATATEEIVVTAQKREELLRDVPQSVSAITGDTLQRVQANDFSDYVGRIPGMSETGSQPGQSRLTLRGLDAAGVASTIGTYIDETPFGSSTALANGGVLAIDLDPYDIARVEVLRGPQGTLYGASTLGGLIKFVTVDPTQNFEGRISGTGESTEGGDPSWGIRGLLNIPLGSQAAVRVSAWNRSQGGYIDDPSRGEDNIDSVDTTGARIKFILHANEDVTVRLSAMTQEIDSDAQSVVDYFPSPLAPIAGDTDQQRALNESNDVIYNIFNGTVDWDLGWASLTSSSSYNELNQGSRLDSTAAFGLASFIGADMDQNKFTQEFRLASPSSDRLEWLAGVYYSKESAALFQDVFLILPPPTGNVESGLNVGLNSNYEEKAAFANLTYHFSPAFDVSVGGRYSHNDQHVVQFGTAGAPGVGDSSDNVTTFSVAPRWHVSDNTMIYARAASGYRPGGPNVLSAFGTIPSTFGPDRATNYEVGFKSDIAPGLFRLDVSAFYIDWKDIQLLVSDGVVSGNANGGSAVSQGVEWTATLTPMEGLSVLWAGAYTDAHLTADTDPAGGPVLTGGLDGDQLPNAAKWTSSLDVDYGWSAFNGAHAYVGGSWRYIGERYTAFDTNLIPVVGASQLKLPSYNVFDLRLGVDFDRYSLELFAKNVTDERDPISFGGFGSTPPSSPDPNGQASILRPRTVGVSVSARF